VASFDQSRRTRRFRPDSLGPETLENREVMAASAMGFSLPDVAVGNFASPVAAWGQPFSFQLQAFNRGASSQAEPLAQFPFAQSTARAETMANVFLVAGHGPKQTRVLLDTVDLGTIAQNSMKAPQVTVTLPATPPAGFPAAGGRFRILVVPTVANQIRLPSAFPNNGASYSVPVKVLPALPQIEFLGSNTPKNLVPGQVFLPEIKIANVGGANVNTQSAQGPLKVILVASANLDYNPADVPVTLAEFTIADLAGLNTRPLAGGLQNLRAGRFNNLNLAANQATLTASQIKLPVGATPEESTYYIGFVIDPDRTLTQISDQAGIERSPRLIAPRLVMPNSAYSTPESIQLASADLFPNLPYKATSAGVITPNTAQVSPHVYYPPTMKILPVNYRGIKYKPQGWI
jgi:hypothetical protein